MESKLHSEARWGLSAQGAAALEQARHGDVEAFGTVCLELEESLWRHSVWLCGDPSTAEDLVQDALLTAWRRLERFDGSCRFYTWVTSILLNVHRNLARKKRVILESDLPNADAGSEKPPAGSWAVLLSQTPDPTQGPSEQLMDSERNTLIRNCLRRLPHEQREVIELRFFAGAHLAEIAAALGCPQGTVKSRLFRAAKKLSNMMDLRQIFLEADLSESI